MDDCCRKIPESGKSCRRLVPEPVRSPWSRCREPFSAAHDIAGAKRRPAREHIAEKLERGERAARDTSRRRRSSRHTAKTRLMNRKPSCRMSNTEYDKQIALDLQGGGALGSYLRSLRPARHYPRLWIQRSSSERRRDLNPPDLGAAQRTL